MNQRGPLRCILFAYELIRAAAVLAAFVSLSDGMDAAPLTAFMAPNALFALMTLFLLVDRERYGAYIPLYIAGKAIFISALLVWSVSSFHDILSSLVMDAAGTAAVVFLSIVLVPADALSILGAFAVRGRAREELGASGPPADGPAATVEVLDAGDSLMGGR